MGTTANAAGSFVGVVVVASALGWFGYQHYQDTREDRLPLKVKQQLANFQKRLPIEVDRGLFLEQFDVKRTSMDLVLRVNRHVDRRMPTEEVTLRTHYWLCKWRDQFIKSLPVTLRITLLDVDGEELTSVENTQDICTRLPSKLPTQHTL